MAASFNPDHREQEKPKRVQVGEMMVGTLLFVVFYLSLKVPSFDEHYREIIGFGYRLAFSLLLLAASVGLMSAVAQRGQALEATARPLESTE
jgi:hypothetical protein